MTICINEEIRHMAILSTILTVIFVIVSVFLILIILLQSNRSAGMGLFGGGSQSAFGSSSGDVLTKTTSVLAALFMLIALGLAFVKSHQYSIDHLQDGVKTTPESSLVPANPDDANAQKEDHKEAEPKAQNPK